MSLIKTVSAFIIGIVATYLCYLYISIPVAPCMTVWLVTFLFSTEKHLNLRITFSVITGIFGIFLHLFGGIFSIIKDPDYMNVFGIIFSFITAFSYLSATVVCWAGLTSSTKK